MIVATSTGMPEAWLDGLGQRAAAGDRVALDLLLRELRPRLLRQCLRLLPCRPDAEDACQEAMLRIATGITSYRGRSRVTTWAYQVTANSSRDTYRRLKRQAQAAPAELVEQPDPRRTSVIAGARVDLLDALEELERASPEFVGPFVLRDIQGLPYEEIASVLDRPLGTIKRQIHQARQWLRSRL